MHPPVFHTKASLFTLGSLYELCTSCVRVVYALCTRHPALPANLNGRVLGHPMHVVQKICRCIQHLRQIRR